MSYKRCSGRLRLLSKLRGSLTDAAALRIYQAMILPIMTYAGIVKLNYNKSQLTKMTSLDNRAKEVIGTKNLPLIWNTIKKRSISVVRKCLDKDVCENFQGYFEVNTHNLCTRNSGTLLKLPKVRLEFSRSSFFYLGAKIYNELPVAIRREADIGAFRKLVDEHFG